MSKYYIRTDFYSGSRLFAKNLSFIHLIEHIKGNRIKDLAKVRNNINFTVTGTKKNGEEAKRDHLQVKVSEKPDGIPYEVHSYLHEDGEKKEMEFKELLEYAFSKDYTKISMESREAGNAKLTLHGENEKNRAEIDIYQDV